MLIFGVGKKLLSQVKPSSKTYKIVLSEENREILYDGRKKMKSLYILR